jgi:aspartyl/asparaginyl beta-hydroxylase (cupin superfamily)
MNKQDRQTSLPQKDGDESLPTDQTSFAYQLLLLQQRLVAYEQLHLEEIAELRQEIEQLRRKYLQETSPQLRAISPVRHKE